MLIEGLTRLLRGQRLQLSDTQLLSHRCASPCRNRAAGAWGAAEGDEVGVREKQEAGASSGAEGWGM